jgi:hypothetical protein
MHDEGVRIIGRGLWYISAVHTQDDIHFAIEKVRKVLKIFNMPSWGAIIRCIDEDLNKTYRFGFTGRKW